MHAAAGAIRRVVLGFVLAASTAGAAPPAAPPDPPLDPDSRAAAEAEARTRLEQIRADMRELTRIDEEKRGEQRAAERRLRETDLALAEAARELRRIDADLATSQQRLDALAAEARTLDQRLAGERAALGTLLRSAYAEGEFAALLPLLAPDRMADTARVLGYHRVLNQRRATRIAAIRADLERSAAIRIEQASATAGLERQREARLTASQVLEAQRQGHRDQVDVLVAELALDQGRLRELAGSERELLRLIERLKDALADIPKVLAGSESFAALRGRLPLPVPGHATPTLRFGSKLPDGRQSQGQTFPAKPGTEVRAVAHGRVAYADWLRGFGLILIIDHGEGYLSLYAHCESLQRAVGDWVQPGEAIATAGDGGAEHGPGLYFELRSKGSPMDPAGWLAR